jgi:oligopeptide/dipeptide ABC transporter ATP-binding protein
MPSGALSTRLAVMYAGKLVETGTCDAVYTQPLYPDTQALLSAAPPLHPSVRRQRIVLPGEVPNPLAPTSKCEIRLHAIADFRYNHGLTHVPLHQRKHPYEARDTNGDSVWYSDWLFCIHHVFHLSISSMAGCLYGVGGSGDSFLFGLLLRVLTLLTVII